MPPQTTSTPAPPASPTTPPRPSPSLPRKPARASSAGLDAGAFSALRLAQDHGASRRRVAHPARAGHGPGRQRRSDARRAHLHRHDGRVSASRAQTLVVTAAARAKDNLRISRPSPSTLRVTDFAGGAYTGSGVHVGAGCTRSGDHTANCSAAGATLIQVSSFDQTDQVVNLTTIPGSLRGGERERRADRRFQRTTRSPGARTPTS